MTTTAKRPRTKKPPTPPPATVSPWEAFCDAVLDGTRVVGHLVRLAVERHRRDLLTGHERGLYFDPAAAQHAIEFFGFLRHSKGEWAGQPFELADWQAFGIAMIFGWMRADGTRRFREAYWEIARKNGKAVCLQTPIPTPDGWTTMGALRVGDQVFDECGAPCVVVAATAVQYERPCYRVRFSDGTSIIADAEHEWFTIARRNGLPRTGLGQKSSWRARHIRTSREIAQTLRASNDPEKVEWNHKVPLAGALILDDVALPIDPYVLGVWLGDGGTSTGIIHEGLQDIDAIRGEVESAGYSTSTNTDVERFCVYGLQTRLRAVGVFGDKHIPAAYLRASIAQRRALLQGLMDTDGTISKAGQCVFTTVRPSLRDGFVELVRSLGYKPTLRTDTAKIGDREYGDAYDVQFWAFADDSPFRLARKTARLKPAPVRPVRSQFRQIIGVDPVPSVPVRCIQVSSRSSLFLAGDAMIPTHNSTIAAGVGLYLFFADSEAGAECYTAATKRDQARIVHEEAIRMVKASRLLRARIGIVKDNLHVKATNSKFEPLGADDDTMDGLNPNGVIVDEYHAHKHSGVYDKLNTATGARRQPLIFTITTAGANKTKSPCGQKNEYCQRVLLGTVEDDETFVFIATIDEGDDWTNEATWVKANLNLGVSVKIDDLRRKARVAMEMPGAQNAFRRLHLNEWTEQTSRWLGLDAWDACAGDIPAQELPEFLTGRACYGALDLASTRDIAAFVLYFPPIEGETAGYLLGEYFVPNENILDRDRKDRTTYSAWRDNELLHATPGNITDYEFIRAAVHEAAERYQLLQLAYDRWNASQLVTQLVADGIDMVPFGQGFASMAAPTKSFEAKIIGRALHHGGHPVLRWMAQNVSVRMDPAGNMKPDKATSGEKIDGIVAAIMAIGIAELQPSDSTASVYDDADLKML